MKELSGFSVHRSPFRVQGNTPGQSHSLAMISRSHQATAHHAPLRRQCHTPPTMLRPSTTGSGMGLGLLIVAELTTLLGGCYGVESQVEAGSRFSIQLLNTNPFLTDLEEVTRTLDELFAAEMRAAPER
jgi:hypothetical protein